MNQATEVFVGGYFMKRGMLVRIDGELAPGRFSIAYVQIRDGQVSGGGGSSAWPASDFTPITDPYLYAAAQVFEANRREHEHTVLASRAQADQGKWLGVMEAIKATCAQAAASPAKEP